MSMDYAGDAYGLGDVDAFPEYGVNADLVPVSSPEYVGGAAEPAAPGGQEEFHSLMTHGPPQNDIYAAPLPPHHGPPARQTGMPMHAQAVGQAPDAGGKHSLGITLLLALAGGAAGYKYGGWAGGGAGVLGAGAVVNAVRAFKSYKSGTDEGDKEGRVSALYTLVGAGGGALLWHKYADKSRMTANPPEQGDDESPFATPCGIRPVGP